MLEKCTYMRESIEYQKHVHWNQEQHKMLTLSPLPFYIILGEVVNVVRKEKKTEVNCTGYGIYLENTR